MRRNSLRLPNVFQQMRPRCYLKGIAAVAHRWLARRAPILFSVAGAHPSKLRAKGEKRMKRVQLILIIEDAWGRSATILSITAGLVMDVRQ